MATTIHCFRHSVLAPALRRVRPFGPSGEHSVTGVYAVLHDAGYRLESLVTADPMEAAGVNDRAQLAVAEAELRDRINERWMRRGVTMWDPERTYVDASVLLEPDVVLLPGVVLQGECRVAAGAEIGPDCHIVDSVIGEGATVTKCSAVRAEVGDHARVGPFVVLGPGSLVAPGEHVGPFARVGDDADRAARRATMTVTGHYHRPDLVASARGARSHPPPRARLGPVTSRTGARDRRPSRRRAGRGQPARVRQRRDPLSL